MKRIFFVILFFMISTFVSSQERDAKGAFTFTISKLADESPMSAAFLNHPITEKERVTVSKDGHLEAGGKRLRIYGTNLSAFPEKKDAAFYARVLANQGFNCVRFHHTDAEWSNCFVKKTESGKYYFSKEGFDRFDFFFAELKKNGIYSNINFLTGRSICSADGYKKEVDSYGEQKTAHALGFWDSFALEDQKKYAATILNHVNPYTGLAYKDDPAVAIVEVNNENGLLMAYASSWLECVNGYYWEELEKKFNVWLKEKNYSYDYLAKKFNLSAQLKEFLVDNESEFYLEEHDAAKAKVSVKDGVRTIAINENGTQGWHVQYSCTNLDIKKEDILTLKFSIKAKKPCSISVLFSQNHEPWNYAGFNKKLNLTNKYEDYEFTVFDLMEDSNLRLCFTDMGFLKGNEISIKNCTIQKGGKYELVKEAQDFTEKNQTVAMPHFQEYKIFPDELKNIYMDFLRETEAAYWKNMKDFIRNEIGAKALVMGTIVTCSTPYLQSVFDIIDSHSYWNHPVFPGNGWDRRNYYIWNRTLTKGTDDNSLLDLAGQRVFGKPFSVSEYDHPYPNQFSGEGPVMLASFASYQDWDCIFTFCSNVLSKNQKTVRISDYFDQSGNPAKSYATPLASRIFRKKLVEPAKKIIYQSVSKDDEINGLYKIKSWSVFSPEWYNLSKYLSLDARIGICLDGYVPDDGIKNEDAKNIGDSIYADFSSRGFISGNKEIYWNGKEGVYIICNDNVTVTVASPNAALPENFDEWKKEGRLLPFVPEDDFIACAGVKEGESYLISSLSWSGNKNDCLREYGTKAKKRNSVIRDQIKLTTNPMESCREAICLGSSAKINLHKKSGTLVMLSPEGLETSENKIKKSNCFNIKATDGSLWYLIKLM